MSAQSSTSPFELRFVALFDPGRGYAFPCDADGQVDIDNLGDRVRLNYFYARSLIGREFHVPVAVANTTSGGPSRH
jgi:hypothetical protein